MMNMSRTDAEVGPAMGDSSVTHAMAHRASRKLVIAVAALLAVHAALAWTAREPGILTGQSDVEHIVLGQSLRHMGYHDLYRVDRPAHAQYPPGYPALLAIWGAILRDGFNSITMLSVLLSGSALWLTFSAVRRYGGDRIALLALLVLCVNPALVAFGGAIAPEPAYLMTSLLALYAFTRERVGGRWLVLAIMAALIAALTRSIGVTLLGGLALHWVLQERWKPALSLAVASLFTVGAWLVWTVVSPSPGSGRYYLTEFRTLGPGLPWLGPLHERMLDHLVWYGRAVVPTSLALPSIPGTWIDNAIVVLLVYSCIAAGLVQLARRWRPAALYLILYGALLIVWHWAADRYLVPVVPLLVVAALSGASRIAEKIRAAWAPHAVAGLALVLALSGAVRSVAAVRDHVNCRRGLDLPDPECLSIEQARFFEAVRWVRDNTPENAVFLVAKSGALFWYSGRRSVSWEEGLRQDSTSFLPWLRRRGAMWIVASGLDAYEPSRLADLLTANCRSLVVARTFSGGTYIFRLGEIISQAESERACSAAAAYRTAHPLRSGKAGG
jgi:hypothetical protein